MIDIEEILIGYYMVGDEVFIKINLIVCNYK